MTVKTVMPEVATSAEAKAWLKATHPAWNIIHSNRRRWWGFLDPRRGSAIRDRVQTTSAEADTPQELHSLIVEAESPPPSAF